MEPIHLPIEVFVKKLGTKFFAQKRAAVSVNIVHTELRAIIEKYYKEHAVTEARIQFAGSALYKQYRLKNRIKTDADILVNDLMDIWDDFHWNHIKPSLGHFKTIPESEFDSIVDYITFGPGSPKKSLDDGLSTINSRLHSEPLGDKPPKDEPEKEDDDDTPEQKATSYWTRFARGAVAGAGVSLLSSMAGRGDLVGGIASVARLGVTAYGLHKFSQGQKGWRGYGFRRNSLLSTARRAMYADSPTHTTHPAAPKPSMWARATASMSRLAHPTQDQAETPLKASEAQPASYTPTQAPQALKGPDSAQQDTVKPKIYHRDARGRFIKAPEDNPVDAVKPKIYHRDARGRFTKAPEETLDNTSSLWSKFTRPTSTGTQPQTDFTPSEEKREEATERAKMIGILEKIEANTRGKKGSGDAKDGKGSGLFDKIISIANGVNSLVTGIGLLVAVARARGLLGAGKAAVDMIRGRGLPNMGNAGKAATTGPIMSEAQKARYGQLRQQGVSASEAKTSAVKPTGMQGLVEAEKKLGVKPNVTSTGKGLSGGGKLAGRLGGAAAVGFGLFDAYETEQDETKTRAEKNVEHSATAGSTVGGLGGAYAGASAGGLIGAAFGGVGAIPGAIIGGIVGGLGGSMGGDKVGRAIGSRVFNQTKDGKVKQGSGSEYEALNFFKSKGWTDEQAAGIVGNLKIESGLKTDEVGDGGTAYGIAQWHPPRQAIFKSVFGKPIQKSTFKEQLEFVQYELTHKPYDRAAIKLRETTTASDAASVFDQYYEQSSGAHRPRRIQAALALLRLPPEQVIPETNVAQSNQAGAAFVTPSSGRRRSEPDAGIAANPTAAQVSTNRAATITPMPPAPQQAAPQTTVYAPTTNTSQTTQVSSNTNPRPSDNSFTRMQDRRAFA